jgi:hypothetical protein
MAQVSIDVESTERDQVQKMRGLIRNIPRTVFAQAKSIKMLSKKHLKHHFDKTLQPKTDTLRAFNITESTQPLISINLWLK